MPRKPSVHTVPDPNGGWNNRVNGQIASHHQTQTTAAEQGRRIAQQLHTEHVIHRPNGQIRDANSYGHDPCPPKG